jgi:hypothetical protein
MSLTTSKPCVAVAEREQEEVAHTRRVDRLPAKHCGRPRVSTRAQATKKRRILGVAQRVLHGG